MRRPARAAIKDALSELLTMFPEADLLNLSEDQRGFAIEHFVAIDVYRRFHLDLGKTIQDKAPTATVALARLKEVKNYIKETVAAAFRKLRAAGSRRDDGARQRIRSIRSQRNFPGVRGVRSMKLVCAPKDYGFAGAGRCCRGCPLRSRRTDRLGAAPAPP